MRLRKVFKDNKQLIAVFLLLAVLVGIMGGFIALYHQRERSDCVQRLENYTADAARQIQAAVERSQNYMDKIAPTIYDRFQASESGGRAALTSFEFPDIISRLELLMPSGTLYTTAGPSFDPSLHYSSLLEDGSGVTRRATDPQHPNSYIVRIHVPVRKGGQLVAVLLGVVELDRLPALFSANAYGSSTKLNLVEGRSGNFLLDPWNETPSNLRSSWSYTFAKGYSLKDYYQDISQGNSGFTVARTSQNAENQYMYYTGVGVEDWVVMLTIPESAVFAQSNSVLFLFVIMLVAMAAVVVVFMVWFLRDVRKRQAVNEMHLKDTEYMLGIQQTLFRAHTQPELFPAALGKVADYLAADTALFFSLESDGQLILRSLGGSAEKAPPKRSDLRLLFPQCAEAVMDTGRFASSHPLLWSDKDRESARQLGVRSMMLTVINSLDNTKCIGVLGAINPDVFWDDPAPLDQVALSFSMALENYKNYQLLAYMSQVDELTGVMNRNCYQTHLEELEQAAPPALGCLYIDANGLHEINNHLGHDAGDEMLRSVADALLSNFDKKCIFRTGGDEFVVLSQDLSQELLRERSEKVNSTVEKLGYSVSMGLEYQAAPYQVSAVIAAAEHAMRQSKAHHYATQGGERQMRNLTSRSEPTRAAKRDTDTLLSFLAPSVLGVYFVNYQKDTFRFIISPPELEELLRDAGGRFSLALQAYTRSYIAPECREQILALGRYEELLTRLQSEGPLELILSEISGQGLKVRVMAPRRAGDNHDEILLIFSRP